MGNTQIQILAVNGTSQQVKTQIISGLVMHNPFHAGTVVSLGS